jgi:hypothetical protein
MKLPDVKVAYVTLVSGTFRFPDLFTVRKGEDELPTDDNRKKDRITEGDTFSW